MIAHRHQGTSQCLHLVFHRVWYAFTYDYTVTCLDIITKQSSVFFIDVLAGNIGEDGEWSHCKYSKLGRIETRENCLLLNRYLIYMLIISLVITFVRYIASQTKPFLAFYISHYWSLLGFAVLLVQHFRTTKRNTWSIRHRRQRQFMRTKYSKCPTLFSALTFQRARLGWLAC